MYSCAGTRCAYCLCGSLHRHRPRSMAESMCYCQPFHNELYLRANRKRKRRRKKMANMKWCREYGAASRQSGTAKWKYGKWLRVWVTKSHRFGHESVLGSRKNCVHPSVRCTVEMFVGATARTNYLQNVHAEAEHRNRMHAQLCGTRARSLARLRVQLSTLCTRRKTTNRQRQICWRPKLHGRSRHFVRIFHNRVHVVRERTHTNARRPLSMNSKCDQEKKTSQYIFRKMFAKR